MILSESSESFPRLGRKSAPRLATHMRMRECDTHARFTSISATAVIPRAARFDTRRGQAKTETDRRRWLPRRHFGTKAIIPRREFRFVLSPSGVLFRPFHVLANATAAESFRRRSQGSSLLLSYVKHVWASERTACRLTVRFLLFNLNSYKLRDCTARLHAATSEPCQCLAIPTFGCW